MSLYTLLIFLMLRWIYSHKVALYYLIYFEIWVFHLISMAILLSSRNYQSLSHSKLPLTCMESIFLGDLKLNHDSLQCILISHSINCFQMVINSAPNEQLHIQLAPWILWMHLPLQVIIILYSEVIWAIEQANKNFKIFVWQHN